MGDPVPLHVSASGRGSCLCFCVCCLCFFTGQSVKLVGLIFLFIVARLSCVRAFW